MARRKDTHTHLHTQRQGEREGGREREREKARAGGAEEQQHGGIGNAYSVTWAPRREEQKGSERGKLWESREGTWGEVGGSGAADEGEDAERGKSGDMRRHVEAMGRWWA